MSKIIFAVFILLVIVSLFLFSGFKKAVGNCKSYSEIECKTKLVCKPTNEYGLHCDKNGCKEGERFKECSSRF